MKSVDYLTDFSSGNAPEKGPYIHRTPKDKSHPFAQIDNRVLTDSRLSGLARGIMAYILSKPDNWQVYQKELEKNNLGGREAIKTAIGELERCGYVTRALRQNPATGKMEGWVFHVYEEPVPDAARTGMGKPGARKKAGRKQLASPVGSKETDRMPAIGEPNDGFPTDGNPSPTNTVFNKDPLTPMQGGCLTSLPLRGR